MRSTAFADAVDRIIALSTSALTEAAVVDGADNPNAPAGPVVLEVGVFDPENPLPSAESVQQQLPGPATTARKERLAIGCRLQSNPESADRSVARRFIVDQLTLLAAALRDDQGLGGAVTSAQLAETMRWYQSDGVAGPLVWVDFSIIVSALLQ